MGFTIGLILCFVAAFAAYRAGISPQTSLYELLILIFGSYLLMFLGLVAMFHLSRFVLWLAS